MKPQKLRHDQAADSCSGLEDEVVEAIARGEADLTPYGRSYFFDDAVEIRDPKLRARIGLRKNGSAVAVPLYGDPRTPLVKWSISADDITEGAGKLVDQDLEEEVAVLVVPSGIMEGISSYDGEEATRCPICLSDAIAPELIDCGHIFCLVCLSRAKDISGKRKCPLCQYMYSSSVLVVWDVTCLVARQSRPDLYKTKFYDEGLPVLTLINNETRSEYDLSPKWNLAEIILRHIFNLTANLCGARARKAIEVGAMPHWFESMILLYEKLNCCSTDIIGVEKCDYDEVRKVFKKKIKDQCRQAEAEASKVTDLLFVEEVQQQHLERNNVVKVDELCQTMRSLLPKVHVDLKHIGSGVSEDLPVSLMYFYEDPWSTFEEGRSRNIIEDLEETPFDVSQATSGLLKWNNLDARLSRLSGSDCIKTHFCGRRVLSTSNHVVREAAQSFAYSGFDGSPYYAAPTFNRNIAAQAIAQAIQVLFITEEISDDEYKIQVQLVVKERSYVHYMPREIVTYLTLGRERIIINTERRARALPMASTGEEVLMLDISHELDAGTVALSKTVMLRKLFATRNGRENRILARLASDADELVLQSFNYNFGPVIETPQVAVDDEEAFPEIGDILL